MERLSETSIGTQTQLHISRKQVGLKLGSLSHKPMVVSKDKMKVRMDWRGKKEVEGETEEAWEEAVPNIKRETLHIERNRRAEVGFGVSQANGSVERRGGNLDECRDAEGEGSRLGGKSSSRWRRRGKLIR